MIKRFFEWINIKQTIDNKYQKQIFEEREIWWVNIGENVGNEENGKGQYFDRPFIVVRKFNKDLLFGIPCSSVKKDNKYYCRITSSTSNFETSALLSQARTLSSRRLIRLIDKIGIDPFIELKKALKRALLD